METLKAFFSKVKSYLIIILIILVALFLIKDCATNGSTTSFLKGCYKEISQTSDTIKYTKEDHFKYVQDSLEKVIKELHYVIETKVPQSDVGVLHGIVKDTSKGYYSTYWYVYNQLLSRADGGFYRIDSALINNKNQLLTLQVSASPVKKDTVIIDSFIYKTHIERDTIRDSSYYSINNKTIVEKRNFFQILLGTEVTPFNKTSFIPLTDILKYYYIYGVFAVNPTNKLAIYASPTLNFEPGITYFNIKVGASYLLFSF